MEHSNNLKVGNIHQLMEHHKQNEMKLHFTYTSEYYSQKPHRTQMYGKK